MKKRIVATIALAAATVAPLASAATYIYTFNDMTWVPNQAKDTFNFGRYWETRDGGTTWGTVWESPYTFTTTYPTQTNYQHFHIGFQGRSTCVDQNNGWMGEMVNGRCVAFSNFSNLRGPFGSHDPFEALYFQLTTANGTMKPFVAKKIDICNAEQQSLTVFVRKTDGEWFYWPSLSGWGNGEPFCNRWTLTSGYSGKFTAMAWMPVAGAGYFSKVGRVEVTD